MSSGKYEEDGVKNPPESLSANPHTISADVEDKSSLTAIRIPKIMRGRTSKIDMYSVKPGI